MFVKNDLNLMLNYPANDCLCIERYTIVGAYFRKLAIGDRKQMVMQHDNPEREPLVLRLVPTHLLCNEVELVLSNKAVTLKHVLLLVQHLRVERSALNR